jgi:hypothetical protein
LEPDATGNKSFQRIEENVVVFIDLNAVVACGELAPAYIDVWACWLECWSHGEVGIQC